MSNKNSRRERGGVLDDQRIAMFRNQRLLASTGSVELALGDGTVSQGSRREQVIAEPMYSNETLLDDPKYLSPDFTNGVDAPVNRACPKSDRSKG